MGDFYFSKIETFDNEEVINPMTSKRKDRKQERRHRKLENLGIFIGKSTEKVLKKAEQFNELVTKLQAEDPTKAVELNQRKLWQMARLKAEGVKLKTDVSKIRKSAKLTKKRKEQSSKRWEERNKKIQQEQEFRQRKRQRNLQKRKDTKRTKKYKKLVKKGHILPEIPKE